MAATDGQVIGTTKIIDSGATSGGFNLVLVSEGYQQNELANFANHAQQFVQYFLSTPPFSDFQCAINVFRIDVASTDSGADDPAACGGTGASPATYFDATLCGFGNLRRALVVDDTLVMSVVDTQTPEWHAIVVIVNTDEWGGTGGTVATSSVTLGWENFVLHEMGHSVFGLADEYPYWEGCAIDTNWDNYGWGTLTAPNLSFISDRNSIKWGDLILPATPLPTTANPDCTECDQRPSPVSAGTVGAFEGGGHFHCGIYRPEYDCKMRSSTALFCAVCQRRIRETLAPYRTGCFAPVFKKSNWFTCIILMLTYLIIIGILAIAALFSKEIRCYLKTLIYRMKYCRKGNRNRCLRI